MKKNIIVLLQLIVISQITWCADSRKISKYYVEESRKYCSLNRCLELTISKHEYCIVEPSNFEDIIISKGKYRIMNSFVICTDNKTNAKIIFLNVDKYRLSVKNKNHFFKYKEFVYLTGIYGSKTIIEHMSWKDGYPNGFWTVWNTKGVKNSLYRKGVLQRIEYKTWDEIDAAKLKDSTQYFWTKGR